MIELLDDEKINEDKKIQLINLSDKKISIKKKSYSVKVKKVILENNFDIDDIEFLINYYDYQSKEIKQLIREILEENIDIISTKEYKFKYSSLLMLIKENKLDKEVLKELVLISIKNIGTNKIFSCLKEIDSEQYESLAKSEQAIISINNYNERLLEALKEMKLIEEYEIVVGEDEEKYYKIIRKELMNV